MKDSANSRSRNGFALVLLLAALLVRAAIPEGYMAETTDAGELRVAICHSDAVWQIPLAEKDGEPKRSADPEPQPCVFAGYGAAVPPAEAGTLPLPASVAAAFVQAETPFALAQAARQLPPARAPPVPA